jgi:hypothetical protein
MRWTLMIGALAWSVSLCAQTTRPDNGVDKQSLYQGIAALRSGAHEQARPLLIQACAKLPRNVKLQDDEQMLASEALGVAYLAARDVNHAAPCLEAAVFSGRNARSAILNTAWALAAGSTGPKRASPRPNSTSTTPATTHPNPSGPTPSPPSSRTPTPPETDA